MINQYSKHHSYWKSGIYWVNYSISNWNVLTPSKNFHNILPNLPDSSQMFQVQGLFLLLSKVIFFVESLIFTESYYRGCLFFTETRPFWPMMVKMIQRSFKIWLSTVVEILKTTNKAENTLQKFRKNADNTVFALKFRLLHLGSKYSMCWTMVH